ncbi:MAG TPA: hypothetical protein VFZ00_21130 [Solirubrobacter sp.]|jgi:hypothetical protein|nr:hypothetical protein [Solirubrobacter sp.]
MRQYELEHQREAELAKVSRPRVTPRTGGLTPATILALQRTAGNAAVARHVTVELRQAPPRPSRVPASDQASPENTGLAAQIDEVDKLDDAALEKQRAANATKVAETEGAAHVAAVKQRDAIEYVASQRLLKPPPKLDMKQWRLIRNDQTKRRQFLNAVVEGRARATGSFREAMKLHAIPDEHMFADLEIIREDAKRFGDEFKRQARINADRMLRNSNLAISELLVSYGIPIGSAEDAANRILKGGGDVAEQAARVIFMMKRDADQPGGADEAAPTRHRMRLAQWVKVIKRQQQRVREATIASNKADMNVSVASTPADQIAVKARQTLRTERNRLAGLWIQAERLHPVLAAYRTGGALEKIELGNLGSEDVELEMQAVLETVLPKVVSIANAQALIKNGRVNPLSLSPVVAMTRANMFVPPGSIRAAVIHDLTEDAKEGDSGHIMILSFALALVTMIPTGGASVAVAAGAASAGLAAYTALKEYQEYEHKKTLIDTDLDRARALSDEEPSLAAFAMTLIGMGLESVMLVHAFRTAVKLRRMAMAGEEAKRLQGMLDELNQLGKKHNTPDLGTQVLDDARKARSRNAFSDNEPTQDMPPLENLKVRRPPVAPSTGVPVYRSREEVRRAVATRLVDKLKWGDGPMLSKEFKLIDRALAQSPGAANEQIAKALPHVVKGIRDPELYAEVMADAWALAKRPPGMDINAALEQMAASGGAPIRYIEAKEGLLDAPVFFEKYAGQNAHFIDLPLQGDRHGAMTHLVQDLVVDRALRRANQNLTSAKFRELLGKAEGKVGVDSFATKSTKTFIDKETEMRTGDYIWRMVYDNTGAGQINRPEELGDQLFLALGIR